MAKRRLVGIVRSITHGNVVVVSYVANRLFSRLRTYRRLNKSVRARFDSSSINLAVGDFVTVEECKPMSRSLHWVVLGKSES